MSSVTTERDAPPLSPAEAAHLPALGVRSLLALVAVAVGVVPFLVLWALVIDGWAPLARLDGAVADALNAAVSDDPALVEVLRAVTDLGGTATAAIVMTGATVLLVVRRCWRPAMFVGVAGIGLLILVPLTKAVVDRARPVVDVAVVAPPENASFPSGHSMASMVVWASILLVALPHLPRRSHPWLVSGVAAAVVGVGLTRLALGVHYVSDVLAGWALGAAWVAATAIVFWSWQRSSGREGRPADPLGSQPDRAADAGAPDATAERSQPLSRRLRKVEVAGLVSAAVGLSLLFVAVGRFIVGGGSDALSWRFDQWGQEMLAMPRSDVAQTAAELVSPLAGSTAVTAVGLALVVLAATLPRPGRAMLFVAIVVLGEVLVYFAISRLVGRARPGLGELAPGLPTDASWPSGHAAAAVAVYGALAVLVLRGDTRIPRGAAASIPIVLAPLVAWSRVYVGEHYLTDVLAGLLLGGLWLVACTMFVLGPPRRRSTAHAD